MTNDHDLHLANVTRRTFVLRTAGAGLGLGLLSGCPHPNYSGQGKATGVGRDQVRKVLDVAQYVLLVLPIPLPCKHVIGVGLRLTSTALSCDYLWESGGERQCVQASYTPTPKEREEIAKKTPVVVENADKESLNDRVLIASADMLALKDTPELFQIRYRCPNVHEDVVPTVNSRYIAAMLQLLGINWRGIDLAAAAQNDLWCRPDWQSWCTPARDQARMWERELKRAKFEAEVRSVSA